ncbi:MAG: hypothetical protein AAF202_04465, partial [Pseudomonadota bacterium]
MKMLLTLLSSFAILISSQTALAYADIAITGGATTTDTDPEADTIDADGGTGFFAGVHGYMQLDGQFFLRAGAVVASRAVSYENGLDQ